MSVHITHSSALSPIAADFLPFFLSLASPNHSETEYSSSTITQRENIFCILKEFVVKKFTFFSDQTLYFFFNDFAYKSKIITLMESEW